MVEPVFIAEHHTSQFSRAQYLKEWVADMTSVAKVKGCTHARVTTSPENGDVIVEAWLERPEDEGEPRWGKATVSQ